MHFLFKPHALMFEEVTASSLITMDLDGNIVHPEGAASNPGYTIHASILKAVAISIAFCTCTAMQAWRFPPWGAISCR